MSNKPVEQKVTISNFLKTPNTQSFLESNLKDKKSEFVSNLIALSENDRNLAQCEPAKLMMCAMNATALNLPLNKNLGFAYIIPYKGIPSFQIGYKGLIQLALRTGQYLTLNSVEIREGEIKRNKITGDIEFIDEYPDNKIIGYIAYLKLKSGFSASIYMSEDDIEVHAKRYSKMYAADLQYKTRKSLWSDSEERPKMAKKTVLKKLIGTYGIISTEIIKAFDTDTDFEINTQGRTVDAEVEIIPQSEPENNQNNEVNINDI